MAQTAQSNGAAARERRGLQLQREWDRETREIIRLEGEVIKLRRQQTLHEQRRRELEDELRSL